MESLYDRMGRSNKIVLLECAWAPIAIDWTGNVVILIILFAN